MGTRPISVLYIISGLQSGGRERQLVEILKNINSTEFRTGVISFGNDDSYTPVVRQHASWFRELSKRPTRLEPFVSVPAAMASFKPDIIHTWDTLSGIYSRIPAWFMRKVFVDGSIRDTAVDKGLNYKAKRMILKIADAVVANSKAGLEAYQVRGNVVYNAIDLRRFPVHSNHEGLNMVMTANFSPYKDYDTFLEAAAGLVEENTVSKVFLLGEGPSREHHMKWISDNHPLIAGRFSFPGSVRNVEEYLSICDIGVLCSTPEFSEGLSNSVLEYMAAGLIPMATATGGTFEIIDHWQNGFLLKPRDAGEIVNYTRLIARDAVLREKLIKNSTQTVQEKFSLAKNINTLEVLYRSLCPGRAT